ncbi:MAG: hypothetical protein JWP52_4320 [Rhizobacter sp.]|nr:hypothetical protein [Rhizobacter sp.]
MSEKQLRLAVHQGDIPALEAMKATLNDFHEDADAFQKMVNKLGLHSQAVRLAVRLREKADPEEQANLAKVLKVLKFLGKDTPPLDFGTLLAVYISFQWRALQAMLAADSSA